MLPTPSPGSWRVSPSIGTPPPPGPARCPGNLSRALAPLRLPDLPSPVVSSPRSGGGLPAAPWWGSLLSLPLFPGGRSRALVFIKLWDLPPSPLPVLDALVVWVTRPLFSSRDSLWSLGCCSPSSPSLGTVKLLTEPSCCSSGAPSCGFSVSRFRGAFPSAFSRGSLLEHPFCLVAFPRRVI